MKIAFNICEFGVAANIGGNVENITVVCDLPDECVPNRIKQAMLDREHAKTHKKQC